MPTTAPLARQDSPVIEQTPPTLRRASIAKRMFG